MSNVTLRQIITSALVDDCIGQGEAEDASYKVLAALVENNYRVSRLANDPVVVGVKVRDAILRLETAAADLKGCAFDLLEVENIDGN